jgi:hypothetical protein
MAVIAGIDGAAAIEAGAAAAMAPVSMRVVTAASALKARCNVVVILMTSCRGRTNGFQRWVRWRRLVRSRVVLDVY